MPRHHLDDPRVQAVMDRLTDLTLELGSVNAVAEELSGDDEPARIYPNRLHGLLAGDPSRSVNSATLEAIEHRLASSERAQRPSAQATLERAKIIQAVTAESLVAGSHEEAITRTAERLGLPVGLVRHVVGDQSSISPVVLASTRSVKADWSWQEVAVERCLRALKKSPRYKAGLVVPTGGGKTRIALTVALRWLSMRPDRTDLVLWVTHRDHLRTQARRTLQKLLIDGAQVPESTVALFERVKFVMVQDLAAAVTQHGANTELVIVDEAHHAAAPSYGPIFEALTAPALFLTATPNRRDELPIGIDEICYTITYRELFERGCLIEPTLEPPLDVPSLHWESIDGLADLADYLLQRAESDFKKTLVVVSQQVRAELLYRALSELLQARSNHVLTVDNLGFVHGSKTSGAGAPSDFLDEFASWPRGILVATGQLIGEGFDEPSIDAVVVTYPSTSIGHLMQVAGRALRTHPGKDHAHVVQVRESPLQYHFHQRWLYQDISDALRPVLEDLTYRSLSDLSEQVLRLLSTHRVAGPVADRIVKDLQSVTVGQTLNLMLTGLPFWGIQQDFDRRAGWGALLVTEATRSTFLTVFNTISVREDDLKESDTFLKQWARRDVSPGSLWKSYVDLIHAMEYARREILATPYAGGDSRPYSKPVGTTWLRYITFKHVPSIPLELERFLNDAVNRAEVLAAYETATERWKLAVKIELPLTGSIAYVLDSDQAQWFDETYARLLATLVHVDPLSSIDAVESQCRNLQASPVPLRLVNELRQFLRRDRFDRQVLRLADLNRCVTSST